MFAALKRSLPLSLVFICSFAACGDHKPTPSQTVHVQPSVNAREQKRLASMDKSPMDIAYFPEDYPVLKMSGKAKEDPVARIIYSRPSKDDRTIFGNVVKYGTYWRLGANEGTEIEFFRDVEVTGRKVKKGRYIIYSVPYEKKWTIKLNDDLYTWGLSIHSAKDVYSFDIPVTTSNNIFEVLTMKFEDYEGGGRLMMAWDSVRTYLPFKY
ncbi:MAG: DUF2911 domain-containing protein [Chitinophagaceae bacterium]|nr:MAG: DUF2911 domain-containing protein [Chitinophagaceae bacterium]